MFINHAKQPLNLEGAFQNTEAFLLLNGPSIKQLPLERLQQPGFFTVGVNNGPRLFRPNLWVCSDKPDKFLPSIWQDPSIIKIVRKRHHDKFIWDAANNCLSNIRAKDCPNVMWFQAHIGFDENNFLTDDKAHMGVRYARSSMLATLKILYRLGIRTVYLLGCDFHMDEKQPYSFNEQVNNQHAQNNNRAYDKLTELLTRLQPHFLAAGFNVYNCNRHSQLKVFPFKDFEEATQSVERQFAQLIQVHEPNSSLYCKTTG